MKNELKVGLTSVAAVAAGTTAAVAGASHPAAPAAAHPVDTGYNWTGFYVGGSYGMMGGDLAWESGSEYQLTNNYLPGVFVGYNQTLSNGVVIGAELEKLFPKNGVTGATSNPNDYGYTSMVDAKFKVGMPILADKRLLLYGFGGMSSGRMSASSNTQTYMAYGANYGVGAEYAITNNIHIGAEVIGRSLDGYTTTDKPYSNQEASLRLSFHF